MALKSRPHGEKSPNLVTLSVEEVEDVVQKPILVNDDAIEECSLPTITIMQPRKPVTGWRRNTLSFKKPHGTRRGCVFQVIRIKEWVTLRLQKI